MIQRASKCCSPSGNTQSGASTSSSSSPSTNTTSYSGTSFDLSTPTTASLTTSSTSSLSFDKDHVKSSHLFIKDDIGGGIGSSKFSRPQIVYSTLKPSITSVSSKKGTKELDQIEWLPDSIEKSSSLITFNLSENRLLALPSSIGNLSSLTKLNLHTPTKSPNSQNP
ncbi:hypothetical protein LXL04_010189 [Taraxacum kok-saghyz]